ncbi:MAG TPA: DUF5618 family protein [Dyadobacter sp.]|nr:DUF5618 family protein [Dyadobacter sp.]
MTSIERARMHIDQAKLILEKKALKRYGLFFNRRYVKMAGRVAYKGLVIVLNDFLGIKGQRKCRMMSMKMPFTGSIRG